MRSYFLENSRAIILGTIFGQLYGSILEISISWWRELKSVRARRQEESEEGRSTLDHVFTLHTLIEQETFVGWCLYSCFVEFTKVFDTVPCDKFRKRLQRLGVPLCLQQTL